MKGRLPIARIGVGLLVGVSLVALTGTNAGAVVPAATKVTMGKPTKTTTSIKLKGKITLGKDALDPIQVANDPMGDDTDGGTVPNGADLGTATIKADLTNQKLIFTVHRFDAPPIDAQPFLAYDWQFVIDGLQNAAFLQAGYPVSTSLPPGVGGDYWYLCNNQNGFACPWEVLTGTLSGDTVSWELPFNSLAGTISRGSVISSGATLGTAPTIASTVATSAVLFYDTGGDDTPADDFTVPGAVKLGIAPGNTPPGSVPTNVTATVSASGAWNGTLSKPSGHGSFILVAKSCFGASTAMICRLASKKITL